MRHERSLIHMFLKWITSISKVKSKADSFHPIWSSTSRLNWEQQCLRFYIRFRDTASAPLRGWAEKFIGWLWCNGRIWPNVFSFQHTVVSPACMGPHTFSISVAALEFSWYIEALILIFEKVLKGPMKCTCMLTCVDL